MQSIIIYYYYRYVVLGDFLNINNFQFVEQELNLFNVIFKSFSRKLRVTYTLPFIWAIKFCLLRVDSLLSLEQKHVLFFPVTAMSLFNSFTNPMSDQGSSG